MASRIDRFEAADAVISGFVQSNGGVRVGRRLVAEVSKFGIVGLINTFVDIALFNVLLFGFGHAAWAAKIGSTAVSATSSYFMNRHWTWRDRRRSGTERELPLFLLISALGLGIVEAPLLVSHYALGLTSKLADNISANVVGLLLATAFRFWASRQFVFRHAEIESNALRRVTDTGAAEASFK